MKKTILAIVAACALIPAARAQAILYQAPRFSDIAETVGALVALPIILPIAVAEGVVAGTAEAADALLNPPVETVIVQQQPVVVQQPVVQQPVVVQPEQVVVQQPVVVQPEQVVVQQPVIVQQPVVQQRIVVRKQSVVVPAPAPVIIAPRPPARYHVRLH